MKRIWYNNGKEEILIRGNNNIPDGFTQGRLLKKKSKLDEIAIKFPKEFIFNLYIVENISFIDLAKRLDIPETQLRRLLTRYKIKKDYVMRAKNNTYRRSEEEIRAVAEKSSKTQKLSWKNKSEEEIEAYRELQRIAHSTDSFRTKISDINIDYRKRIKETSPEIEEERNRKRSESCSKTRSNPELIERRNEVSKQRRAERKGMLCRTMAEQKMYDTLISIFPDLQYDIRVDERYPFFCDFYIPSLDTFIELQAHPSHGRLPMYLLSPDEYARYPQRWADVFADRDVRKIETANKNKLHYIMIYPRASLEENFIINKNEDKSFVEICYRSQKIKFPS